MDSNMIKATCAAGEDFFGPFTPTLELSLDKVDDVWWEDGFFGFMCDPEFAVEGAFKALSTMPDAMGSRFDNSGINSVYLSFKSGA
jgi:hypothetical protein